MKTNPDINHVQVIIDKLNKNDGFCPCLPNRNEDTICPCRYMRELQACRCGLYVR